MRIVRYALGAGAVIALAACVSTPKPGPVSVTRFVEPAALESAGKGSFFVESAPGVQMDPAELAAYKAAVAQELTELGYVEGDRASASVHAVVRADSAISRPETSGRGPVSVGVGGSTGSYTLRISAPPLPMERPHLPACDLATPS